MARDIGTLLDRALIAAASRSDCSLEIAASTWRRWASATFVGARHSIVVRASASAAFDAWLGGLCEAEFSIAGHLVADLRLVAVERSPEVVEAVLEILTVEVD